MGSRRAGVEKEKVTLRARPGWKLTEPKDGVLELTPGVMMAYAVAGELGEDAGGGDGHTCNSETTVKTNCLSKPIISLTNLAARAENILVPQTGVMSTMVTVSATVNVVSNGNHEIITTESPCTVVGCDKSDTKVTTNNVAITPSSFVWELKIAGVKETKVGGADPSLSVPVRTPGDHAVSLSATATNLPPCCACSASALTNALVMQLESVTEVDQPEDKKRLIVGVGEVVHLYMLPLGKTGATIWGKEGLGKISSQYGETIDFIAYEREDWTRVVAFINGLMASLAFTTIEPNAVIFQNSYEPYPGGGRQRTYTYRALKGLLYWL